jgi:hypothetical protein
MFPIFFLFFFFNYSLDLKKNKKSCGPFLECKMTEKFKMAAKIQNGQTIHRYPLHFLFLAYNFFDFSTDQMQAIIAENISNTDFNITAPPPYHTSSQIGDLPLP